MLEPYTSPSFEVNGGNASVEMGINSFSAQHKTTRCADVSANSSEPARFNIITGLNITGIVASNRHIRHWRNIETTSMSKKGFQFAVIKSPLVNVSRQQVENLL